jgi:hypothetical protein
MYTLAGAITVLGGFLLGARLARALVVHLVTGHPRTQVPHVCWTPTIGRTGELWRCPQCRCRWRCTVQDLEILGLEYWADWKRYPWPWPRKP